MICSPSAQPICRQVSSVSFRRADRFLNLLLDDHLEGLCCGSALGGIGEGDLFEETWIAKVGPGGRDLADFESPQGVGIVADAEG